MFTSPLQETSPSNNHCQLHGSGVLARGAREGKKEYQSNYAFVMKSVPWRETNELTQVYHGELIRWEEERRGEERGVGKRRSRVG